MGADPRYWFPAKRYGWGWGPPSSWQGHVVLVAYVIAVAAAAMRLMPGEPLMFTMCLIAATVVLIGVCLVKGEPPSWRWGK